MLYIVLIVIVVGIIAMLLSVQKSKKVDEKIHETSELLKEISKTDAIWNEEDLISQVESSYYKIMSALASKNFEDLKELIYPTLLEKWKDRIEQSGDINPENLLDNRIEEIKIVNVDNYVDNAKDSFTAEINIMEAEYTVDRNGKLIFDKYNSEQEDMANGLLTEFWKFERSSDNWLVVEVSRDNNWKKIVSEPSINEE